MVITTFAVRKDTSKWMFVLLLTARSVPVSYTHLDVYKRQDDDSVLFGYSASAVGVIYNTTVFSTLDADWKDLGNAFLQEVQAIFHVGLHLGPLGSTHLHKTVQCLGRCV